MSETDFKTYVDQFHAQVKSRRFDHFELLGLPKNATFDEIEKAYKRLANLFCEENMADLGESESAEKALYLRQRVDHAYDVLTDHAKRRDYENRGFREADEVKKVEQPPDIARGIYAKAKVLYNRKDYRHCLDAVDQALKLEPRAEYYHLLGLCQMNIPTLERKAEVSLLKAAEMEPWNAEHFFVLGMLFYNMKLPQRAVVHFKKALHLEPGHKQAQWKLAELEGPKFSAWENFKERLLRVLRKLLPSLFRDK